MTYRIYTDGIFGGVKRSDETPNGDDVFATLAAARKGLAARFDRRAREFREAARDARSLRAEDVEDDTEEDG